MKRAFYNELSHEMEDGFWLKLWLLVISLVVLGFGTGVLVIWALAKLAERVSL